MSLQSPLPAKQTPPDFFKLNERSTEASIINISERGKLFPVGISYLGGTAIFNAFAPEKSGIPRPTHLPHSMTAIHSPLTAREKTCATFAMLGQSNGEIGARLYLSEDTVKTHMRRLYYKINVDSREQLLDRFLQFDDSLMVLVHPSADPNPLDTLSEREKEVGVLASKGYRVKRIAHEIGLSPLTIKSHLARMRTRFATGDRALVATGFILSGLTEHIVDPSEGSAANRSIMVYRYLQWNANLRRPNRFYKTPIAPEPIAPNEHVPTELSSSL